jgi:putative transposase
MSQFFSHIVKVQSAPARAREKPMFKGRPFDRSVILLCVRWYLAYGLSLRNLEEMMADRGSAVDHATIHPWTLHFAPLLRERCNQRKRAVGSRWPGDETYIKGGGEWMDLSPAVDSAGDTVEFPFSKQRDLAAAQRIQRRALGRHGRPERIVIDGSPTNREAMVFCDTTSRLQNRPRRWQTPIRIRRSRSLDNRIERDHRLNKRRIAPMLGFKAFDSAHIILGGIEMAHMMHKRQARYAFDPQPSPAEQFDLLAA